MKKIILTAFMLTAAATGLAHAEEGQSCTSASKDKWMSENSVKEKAKAAGLDVRRLKVEGSCYEVYAIDTKGNKMEALFNPETGEAVGNEVE